MGESKALGHDDESGFIFAKEMLGGDVTATVNFDRFMKHPQRGLHHLQAILIDTGLKIKENFCH